MDWDNGEGSLGRYGWLSVFTGRGVMAKAYDSYNVFIRVCVCAYENKTPCDEEQLVYQGDGWGEPIPLPFPTPAGFNGRAPFQGSKHAYTNMDEMTMIFWKENQFKKIFAKNLWIPAFSKLLLFLLQRTQWSHQLIVNKVFLWQLHLRNCFQ